MTDEPHDHPNVLVLPPILLLATIAVGIILDWLICHSRLSVRRRR